MSEPEVNIGKQAKDLAEAANTSVDAVNKLASFLDGLFGHIITNSVGLLGDKLAYYRLENAIKLQDAVEQKLARRGVKKRFVPVSFGLPIIEKATVEEDPVLQEKWANLLANARDATYDKPLRRNFTTMLADMEALDAHLLDLLVREHLVTSKQRSGEVILFDMKKLVANSGIPETDCENAIRNLMRLGLLKPGVVEGGVKMGDHLLSSYKDTEMFDVTQMGIDFFHAVNETR